MDVEFEGVIVARDEVDHLPGTWTDAELRDLIGRLGIDDAADMSSADLPDMVAMALQDRAPEEAADLVLECVFGERMKPGVRQNLIPELKDDAPWEQFPDVFSQRGICIAAVLLQRVFPKVFTKPEIARLELTVAAKTKEAKEDLAGGPDPSLVARLVADAVGEKGVLHRIYDEELERKKRFADAPAIVWLAELAAGPDSTHTLVVHTGAQWVRGGAESGSFQSSAFADPPVGAED